MHCSVLRGKKECAGTTTHGSTVCVHVHGVRVHGVFRGKKRKGGWESVQRQEAEGGGGGEGLPAASSTG